MITARVNLAPARQRLGHGRALVVQIGKVAQNVVIVGHSASTSEARAAPQGHGHALSGSAAGNRFNLFTTLQKQAYTLPFTSRQDVA